jgi:hypothetical protein
MLAQHVPNSVGTDTAKRFQPVTSTRADLNDRRERCNGAKGLWRPTCASVPGKCTRTGGGAAVSVRVCGAVRCGVLRVCVQTCAHVPAFVHGCGRGFGCECGCGRGHGHGRGHGRPGRAKCACRVHALFDILLSVVRSNTIPIRYRCILCHGSLPQLTGKGAMPLLVVVVCFDPLFHHAL